MRTGALDEASRERLAEIYERSIVELSEALSPDLQEELRKLALPFKDGEVPSDGEIRVAKAQLVGWLEGLFHGIQATLFAQQIAARQQFEACASCRRVRWPGGPGGGQLPPGAAIDSGSSRHVPLESAQIGTRAGIASRVERITSV